MSVVSGEVVFVNPVVDGVQKEPQQVFLALARAVSAMAQQGGVPVVENNETDALEFVKPLWLHLGLFVESTTLLFCYIFASLPT